MSAYKKLNKQDAYITTYTAHKSWAVSGSDFTANGVITANTATSQINYLNSIKQLYYPSKSIGNGEILSHSFDYYYQTTLNTTSSRNLSNTSYILSIPRTKFGNSIHPDKSFTIRATTAAKIDAIQDGYTAKSYITDPSATAKTDPVVGPTFTLSDNFKILDDGEGALYLSGSTPLVYVGDIIYPHGIAIISNKTVTDVLDSYKLLTGPSPLSLSWKSSHPIYTHTYHCKIRESEYNYTYNPSALTSSIKTVYDNNGDLYNTTSRFTPGGLNDNVTGSAFQPYITTVGLYNDTNELIAVAKMGQPIPKSANTEMTIIVKIDI